MNEGNLRHRLHACEQTHKKMVKEMHEMLVELKETDVTIAKLRRQNQQLSENNKLLAQQYTVLKMKMKNDMVPGHFWSRSPPNSLLRRRIEELREGGEFSQIKQ